MRAILAILTYWLFIFLIMSGIEAKAQTKTEIVRQISAVAQASGIDPDIAVAIATVESSLNPNAIGVFNEQGLFQLHPLYHTTIPGNVTHNILVGVAYMVELKAKNYAKYGDAWFVLYNYGPNRPPKKPRETAYYRKVVTELNKLKVKRYLVAR